MKKNKKTNERAQYISFPAVKREMMRDAEFRKAYKAVQPKYAVIRALLDARIKRGVTQEEIARRAGTTQSAIARFESGAANPTLEFLTKVAGAVGAKIEVRVTRSAR